MAEPTKYPQEAAVGSLAMRAVEDWLTCPDPAYKQYEAGLTHFAHKYGISKTSLGRAKAIANKAPDLAQRLAADEITLRQARKQMLARHLDEFVAKEEPASVAEPADEPLPAPPADTPRAWAETFERRFTQIEGAIERGNSEWQLLNARLKRVEEHLVDLKSKQAVLEKRLERDERDGNALLAIATNAASASETARAHAVRLERQLAEMAKHLPPEAFAERQADLAAAILRLERRLEEALTAPNANGAVPDEMYWPPGWVH